MPAPVCWWQNKLRVAEPCDEPFEEELDWVESYMFNSPLSLQNYGESERYGFSAAMNQYYALVGSPYEVATKRGAVLVYTDFSVGSYGTDWQYTQALYASDPANYDEFGGSVAIAQYGSHLIAGANADDITYSNQGSAHIFVDNDGTWEHQQKIIASDPSASAHFGASVAMNGDGDVVAVTGGSGVYMFHRSGATWTQVQKIAVVGSPVMFAGSRLFIGDSNATVSGNTNAGKIRVYTYGGSWTEETTIESETPEEDAYFGLRFHTNGASLCAFDASSGLLNVYFYDDGDWVKSGELGVISPETTATGGLVADNWYIFVRGEEVDSTNETPKMFYDVYQYSWDDTEWSYVQRLTPENRANIDDFGSSGASNQLNVLAGCYINPDFGEETHVVFFRNTVYAPDYG